MGIFRSIDDVSRGPLPANTSQGDARQNKWEVNQKGLIRLPWPCDALCANSTARCVFDVGDVISPVRCFVVLDTESDDALCNWQEATVSLVSQSLEPRPDRPFGNIVVR